MIEAKPDWVISRQRAWGVPIAVFVHKETSEVLKDERVNKRIADAFEKEGADAWFADKDGARFLAPDYKPADYEKVNDILDVWFDSGSTHAFTLEVRADLKAKRPPAGKDRVLYLEGSDQHRGWFQSSLLESCGTRGRPPFDIVLTHGFILDEKGEEKMSKSRGNIASPNEVTQSRRRRHPAALGSGLGLFRRHPLSGPKCSRISSRRTASLGTRCAGCWAACIISSRRIACRSRKCPSSSG